ncbi:hypothetical protein A3D70_00625 [Candidatus Adlerbacteria bacterium RIFCSPHIGHO2_02_FULL_54_18]|uniref:Uncharacterized protein n=1 Tax=Candidatus Adlerbacteria bacterium RIFCSPHIGHO2_02_FULL_54_18 TaxID=1797241 RepID=A0A1F4Y3B7_9BACT|nr:MAG: hypothetical protein A3D70_00625 [Candidatus Adlerbacteria bacterium RIFCSPHIGHO2_02_FULL_54_18]
MNKKIIIPALLLVAVAVVGALFFLRPSAPAPITQNNIPPVDNSTVSVPPSDADELAVQAAYQRALYKDNFDNVRLYQTVVSGSYALQEWRGDTVGGEALLKFDTIQNEWVIVSPGGGAWSVDGLVEMGVPQAIAAGLLSGMLH